MLLIVDDSEEAIRSKNIERFQIKVELGKVSDNDIFILEVRLKSQQRFELKEYGSFFEARYEYEKIMAALENGSKVYVIE